MPVLRAHEQPSTFVGRGMIPLWLGVACYHVRNASTLRNSHHTLALTSPTLQDPTLHTFVCNAPNCGWYAVLHMNYSLSAAANERVVQFVNNQPNGFRSLWGAARNFLQHLGDAVTSQHRVDPIGYELLNPAGSWDGDLAAMHRDALIARAVMHYYHIDQLRDLEDQKQRMAEGPEDPTTLKGPTVYAIANREPPPF